MINDDMLYVQHCRWLTQSVVVLSGPKYSDGFLRHDGEEVNIIDPSDSSNRMIGRVNWKYRAGLASSEMFGFDPITTEFPCLRTLQRFGTVIVEVTHPQRELLGMVVSLSAATDNYLRKVQAEVLPNPPREHVRIPVDEILRASESEHFVWRAQPPMRYVIVLSRVLARQDSMTTPVVVAGPPTSLDDGRLIDVFATVGKGKERRELKMGQVRLIVTPFG